MLRREPTECREFELLRLLLNFDGVFQEDDDVGVGPLGPHRAEVRADLRRGRGDLERPRSDARIVAPGLQSFEQRTRQRGQSFRPARRGRAANARTGSAHADGRCWSTTMIPVRIRWMMERLTRSRSATSAARDSDVISVRRSLADRRLDRDRRREVDRAEDSGLKIVAAIVGRHQRDVELLVEHHDARDGGDECTRRVR